MLVTGNKLCDTCCKSDVCEYGSIITKKVKELSLQASEITEPKLRITINCESWLGRDIRWKGRCA